MIVSWAFSSSDFKALFSSPVFFTRSCESSRSTTIEIITPVTSNQTPDQSQVYVTSAILLRVNVLKFCTLTCLTKSHMQTVQTQIRLLLRSSLIRVYTVCYSTKYFKKKLHQKQNSGKKKKKKKLTNVFKFLGHLLYYICIWYHNCLIYSDILILVLLNK